MKPDFSKYPPCPQWAIDAAEKWRRLIAAGMLVYVPMTKEELAETQPDLL